LAFPALRLDLGAVAPGPRGCPLQLHPAPRGTILNLRVLRASFGDSYRCAPSFFARLPAPLPKPRPLSSQLFQTASHGVVQRSPLRRPSSVSPLPASSSRRNPLPSTEYCQAPDAFRPCRSSRLRRLTPHRTVQVYCTLHPAMGFELFQPAPLAGRLAAPVDPRDPPQARLSHPPEPFPWPQPHCVTAAVASSLSAWCLPPSEAPPK
jgi:hypothetical protein